MCSKLSPSFHLVLQVPVIQPSGSASTLLPMVLFQNVSEGPPNSVLQVAVKNNQQPVWYFTDKIPLQVLFVEDGKMERATFLEVHDCIVFWRLRFEGVLLVLFKDDIVLWR